MIVGIVIVQVFAMEKTSMFYWKSYKRINFNVLEQCVEILNLFIIVDIVLAFK